MATYAQDADASTQAVAAVATAAGVDIDRGLDATEAASRLAAHGPNMLDATPPVPLWRRVLGQFADPLVYLLIAAFGITMAAWLVEGRHGVPYDSVVIALVVIANATLGLVQERRSASAVAALQRMSAASASVVRGGQHMRIPALEVVVGDILLLAEGDAVAADARVLDADLRVVEASLTGESSPVQKSPDPLASPTGVGERTCMVFAGTAVTRGRGRAIVTATGMDTETGRVARLLGETESDPTPLQREIAGLSRSLGIAVIAIAAVVIGTVWLTLEVSTFAHVVAILLLGVALAVAAVPEGLPAILSVVLALGVRRMADHRAIVRDLSSVETLGSASVICTDKTGTLTVNRMTLTSISTLSGSVEVSQDTTAAELPDEARAVIAGGCVANDAVVSDGAERVDGDPTDVAFVVAERECGLRARDDDRPTRAEAVSFSSERARMSVVAVSPDGTRTLHVKGAPEVVLELCTTALEGGSKVTLDDDTRAAARAGGAELARRGMRTLAVAHRVLDAGEAGDESAERDLTFSGIAGLVDPPRPEAEAAVADAQRAGIRVVMITGDHPATAVAIARALGISAVAEDAPTREGEALTGAQVAAMSEDELRAAVVDCAVFARVAPEHKLRIVDALQANGEVVSMTGDGVNDAPALRSADIGVAMGQGGTEVAREAASMILADDNFATIVTAVREGRGILDNIKRFLRYLLASNFGEVLTVFVGVVAASWLGLTGHGEAVAIPLLATQILWINLLTDLGPALAIGAEPYADDLMDRKPRRLTERLIDAEMWRGIIYTGVAMAVVTLGTFDLLLPGGVVEGDDSLATARTAAFTVLVFAHLTNAFSARSEATSIVHGLRANRWLWGAVALSALLQVAVVHVPLLNKAFSTAPLTLAQWAMCLAIAMLVPLAIEGHKWLLRRRGRQGLVAR